MPLQTTPSTDIYDRLTHLMNHKQLTAYRFSKELGFDKPAKLYAILRRKTKPSFETLVTIATTYDDIDCNWLLRGTGEAFRDDSVSVTDPAGPELLLTLKEAASAAEPESRMARLTERTEALQQQLSDRDDVITHLKEEIFFLRELVRQHRAAALG
jgi:hypothetical protein